MLDWLELELFSEVSRIKYDLHIALLEYALEKKTFDLHWDQAQELQQRIAQHKLSWLSTSYKPSQSEIKSLAEQWKQTFGDPSDPEVARRIEATVQALRSRNQPSL